MTIKKGWYKHFKGNYYYVTGTAINTETLEDMVIYYCKENPSDIYVRPASMWNEMVDGKPRFKFIGDNVVWTDGRCTISIPPDEVLDE
jgi:hypothetical protein